MGRIFWSLSPPPSIGIHARCSFKITFHNQNFMSQSKSMHNYKRDHFYHHQRWSSSNEIPKIAEDLNSFSSFNFWKAVPTCCLFYFFHHQGSADNACFLLARGFGPISLSLPFGKYFNSNRSSENDYKLAHMNLSLPSLLIILGNSFSSWQHRFYL